MKSLDLIKKHEGLRLKPYKDSVGVLTVGYGHNLEVPITEEVANEYLAKDYAQTVDDCNSFPWYKKLDKARKAVVENMIFNMGLPVFSTFKNTIKFIEQGYYEQASFEMLESKWRLQVGKRAVELATIMRTGRLT